MYNDSIFYFILAEKKEKKEKNSKKKKFNLKQTTIFNNFYAMYVTAIAFNKHDFRSKSEK